MVEANLQQQINAQLFDKLGLAYICVDSSMAVVDVSDNLSRYGYDNIFIGAQIEDGIDFMFGLDAQTQIDLPMIESPSGVIVSVSLLPSENSLTVLILDAKTQAKQRQLLQQKANENELLVERQDKLLDQLEFASQQLEHKNEQLEEASRLQTSFLSGVSHEFRTPLTSIIGYTNIVEQSLQSSTDSLAQFTESSADHLRAVQRSSRHLLSLVENLLDHGKLDSNAIILRPKANDLAELFEDVKLLLKPLSNAKHIELDYKLDITDSTIVVIDDSRLRQCLINLLGNAIKFTDYGSVCLSAELQDDFLLVKIDDTGPGISPEDLEKIRLPFWQAADTGKAGTGLGLTITDRIIELMGGSLEVLSVLGQGTQIYFQIPAPKLPEQVNSDVSKPKALLSDMAVLLAEDDHDIADLMVMMMAERGVHVTHVENGALALEALESNAFDFVLMDIHMPVMTGYEALAALQKANNMTPVAIMSASAVDADRAKAENFGCYDYLVKPVDIDDIIEIINQVAIDATAKG
ncbi:MAG: two-component system sensor histidine kinase/response regulator [Arenicella sp.]|jgi:signal transduction histidine kinase/ActR/RegA family two-component response regulator